MPSASLLLRAVRRILPLLPLVCWCIIHGDAARAYSAETAPPKVWRIAYVEGGPFVDYQKILRGVAAGLQRMGLIENGSVPLPEKSEDVSAMWEWLARNAGGTAVRFLPDGFYSADWDTGTRETNRTALLERIRERKDVDMLLAFGTWGGQDFADADIDIPVIVASVTNAVEAGIIPSVEDSGRDNLTAH